MRHARALTLLLPVALLVPVTGVAGPASAETTTAATTTTTGLTIDGTPDLGVFHDSAGPESTPDVVRHRGQLTTDDGEPIRGVAVQLRRKLDGGGWRALTADAVTDEEGRYEFLSYLKGNARYQVEYAGDELHDPAASALHRLRAMRDFNAVLVKKRSAALLKGNINPGWGNKAVRWQKKSCSSCAWKTIDRARSGERGAWRFRGYYPPVGKRWFYRAEINGTTRFVVSRSATLVTTRPGRVPAARSVVR